ncbi:MAG: tetraacyldisaccharide 4'-kinase [Spirochaetia bacterium]|nr:tetraacyldisaccharide 4'-kinase [Spirochaetia bacterium]
MKFFKTYKNPLDLLYILADQINKFFKKSRKIPSAKTISIGNITTGGTGKTPAVIYFARLLKEKFKPAILCRGYGGTKVKKGGILSDGKKIQMSVEESGDEPYLLAANLMGIPVAVGRRRHRTAGLFRKKNFDLNLFILDDGFQHYALRRDLDIVLIDAYNPFGNGHILPLGTLREPPEALKRAHIIVVTKSNLISKEALSKLKEKLRLLCGHDRIYFSIHRPVSLIQLPFQYNAAAASEEKNLKFLKNKEIWALSGIGSHRAFEQTLLNLGAKTINNISYRDHHKYTIRNIQSIVKRVKADDILITTEKDWVKLEAFAEHFSHLNNFYYLKIEFTVIESEKKLLEEVISLIR